MGNTEIKKDTVKSQAESLNTIEADSVKLDTAQQLLDEQEDDSNNKELSKNQKDIADTFKSSIENRLIKGTITAYYGINGTEYDEISKRAIGILGYESNFGADKEIIMKEIGHKLSPNFDEEIGRYKSNGLGFSRGLTQLKFTHGEVLTADDKTFLATLFNIKNPKDLNNPRKCGIATMVGLVRLYKEIIIPMKSEKFRTHDAEIIRVTYNNELQEDFAVGVPRPAKEYKHGQPVDNNIEQHPRTAREVFHIINGKSNKYEGVKNTEIITRKGLKDDNFYDYLYLAWNKPNTIRQFGSATLEDNYVKIANERYNKYIDSQK